MTDVADMKFVADPFVVKSGSTYYLFCELCDLYSVQRIGYFTSTDGLSWTYGKMILDNSNTGSTLLSYPMVFKVDSAWYMMCDLNISGVALMKATNFPNTWTEPVQIISPSYRCRDASIFQWDGHWYCLFYDYDNTQARLYHSSSLVTGWVEHPSSPMYSGATNSRPAGRPIVRDTSIDIFFQDGSVVYGQKVRSFRITTLSPTEYVASEIAQSPLLEESGSGWNSHGMHHLDRIDTTLSIADGFDENDIFTIGIYQDVPPE